MRAVAVRLPVKQGLKLMGDEKYKTEGLVAVRLPVKQGLKRPVGSVYH